MLHAIAWILIVLAIFNLVVTPAMLGQTRKRIVYNYGDFIIAIISALLIIPLCLRVLGWI